MNRLATSVDNLYIDKNKHGLITSFHVSGLLLLSDENRDMPSFIPDNNKTEMSRENLPITQRHWDVKLAVEMSQQDRESTNLSPNVVWRILVMVGSLNTTYDLNLRSLMALNWLVFNFHFTPYPDKPSPFRIFYCMWPQSILVSLTYVLEGKYNLSCAESPPHLSPDKCDISSWQEPWNLFQHGVTDIIV